MWLQHSCHDTAGSWSPSTSLLLFFEHGSLIQHVSCILVHVELGQGHSLHVKCCWPIWVDALSLHCIPKGSIWLITHQITKTPSCMNSWWYHGAHINELQILKPSLLSYETNACISVSQWNYIWNIEFLFFFAVTANNKHRVSSRQVFNSRIFTLLDIDWGFKRRVCHWRALPWAFSQRLLYHSKIYDSHLQFGQ